MRDLLNFKTKRDRDDFLIALTVIGLFFGFSYGILSCDNDAPLANQLPTIITPIPPADKDEDGIPDETDKCPTLAGNLLNGGCPTDTDGDGIYDTVDKCPNLAGNTINNGCPPDGDGDGIPDIIDKCPKLAGTAATKGCPPDTDGDGIFDSKDKCPTLAGVAKNNGCPEVVLEEAERTLLHHAMQNVEFQINKATLKPASTTILNQIANLMKKYKSYKLDIDGFTDNTGDAQKNRQLSLNRAKACYEYLSKAGIPQNRMSFRGYGQSRPIASNDTPTGRRKNRRVEFNLHY